MAGEGGSSSTPALPPGLGSLPEVLQDGIEGLMELVDTKVNWVMPNSWVWIPGTYEWSFDSAAGVTPEIQTKYHLELLEDSTMVYTWYNMEKHKKKTEHSVRLEGVWKGPEKIHVDAPPKEVSETESQAGDEGEERPSSPVSVVESDSGQIEIDIIVVVPTKISFQRSMTGSTNKAVTIKTKTDDGFMPIQLGEGFIQPFELQFQITDDGKLIRADKVTAEHCFPPNKQTIDLVGVTKKATARLGDPHVIITENWVPSGPAKEDADSGGPPKKGPHIVHEMSKVDQAPFEPLQWLAHYLKTHSPKFEAHTLRKKMCQSWLTKTGQHAAAKETASEFLEKRGAAAAQREAARVWLLTKVQEFHAANVQDED
jgi:hypothetical protein